MKFLKSLLFLSVFISFNLTAQKEDGIEQDSTIVEQQDSITVEQQNTQKEGIESAESTTTTKEEEEAFSPEAIAANHALFDSEDILELTLTSDLTVVRKDIGEKRTYHPANISYQNEEGDLVSIDLKVKTRGNSRRSKNMCNFPPLRLNFKKDNTSATIFEGQDKLKLVVHCQENDEEYKEYMIREYLVYKAYELLSDMSFRVRLFKIKYVDTGGKKKQTERYGFIIEDQRFLAERLGGTMLKDKKIHAESMDKTNVDIVSVFQYMIGNLDWSVKENHNMKLCYIEGNLPYCIPYDFDLTGIVHTEYALPPEMLPVNSVRNRLFRGYCRTAEEFETTFKVFLEIKEELYKLYQDSDLLSNQYIKSTLKYLDDFYEVINDPKLVKREFLKKCRKLK